MKYLVLLGVLLVAWMLWRNKTRGVAPPGSPKTPGTQASVPAPQDMVRCESCALHLPRLEAVAGAGGRMYCSQEHRLGAGD